MLDMRFEVRRPTRTIRRLSGCRKSMRMRIIEWISENFAGRIEKTWRFI